MAGRKPTPAEIRALTGNRSTHPPANPAGLKIKRPISTAAPSWMNKLQKEIWKEGLEGVPRNLLRVMDTSVYQSWVFCAYAQRRAFTEFERTGEQMLIVLGNGSVKANPLLTMIRNEGAQMLRLASEMGFTPTARMRVKPDDDTTEESNPFDQFVQSNGQASYETEDGPQRSSRSSAKPN